MSKFGKSSAQSVERFDALAARHPVAQRRQMFGCPSLFLGGNLATCLFADGWALRLSPADAVEALALPGAAPFSPMPGRSPMTGWAKLPPSVVADDAALDAWLLRALAYAGSLPAKR